MSLSEVTSRGTGPLNRTAVAPESLEECLRLLLQISHHHEAVAVICLAERYLEGILLSSAEHGTAVNRLRNALRYFEGDLPGAAHYEVRLLLTWLRRVSAAEPVCEPRRRLRSANEQLVSAPLRPRSAVAGIVATAMTAVSATTGECVPAEAGEVWQPWPVSV
ncbi:MAG: hypothetical protein RLZZ436_1811 [Planctomycetota bacterium]|jgi:hypothetical protein